MIFDAIAHLDSILVEDDLLKAELTEYNGSPAIAFQVAPKDMEMPYLVTTSVGNTADSNYITDRSLYGIDIYVPDGDIVRASRIAERIIEMFNMSIFPEDIGLNIWKEWDNFLPEDDPSIIRYHVEFGLRHI